MTRCKLSLAFFLFGVMGVAQTQDLGFSYRQPGAAATTLTSGAVIQFPAVAVGSTAQVILLIENRGNAAYSVTEVTPTGQGFSGDIRVPLTVRPGELAQVALSFTPQARNQSDGTLTVRSAAGTTTSTFVFFLRGTGLDSQFAASYIVNPNGNQLALADGATITFNPAQPGQTSTVTIIIQNRGTAAGTLDRVTVSGDGFQVTGLPLLPTTVGPDREVRFGLAFSPAANAQLAGTLLLQLSGTISTIHLRGNGVSSVLSYEYRSGTDPKPVLENGSVAFPPAEIGTPQTVAFRVRNSGAVAGRITSIAVTGTGFRAVESPVLPATIASGESLEFALSYTPQEPGELHGRLRIDGVSFDLVGTGLGAQLTFLAATDGTSVTLVPNGAVNFTNTAVGSTSAVNVRIENAGNRPATISSIAVAGAPFHIGQLPSLPAVIAPGESTVVALLAKPETLGLLSGTLQIDETRFTLRVSGAAPPPVPEVSIQSSGATVEALQQPAASVTIASPYHVDLTGKLSLAFASESFSDDPAIQFPTGGRSIDFRIPAGTTEAMFADGSKQISFQTGTVAGSITLSASLAVASVNVTPTPAPSRAFTIASGPPRIRGVQAVPRAQGSLDLIISGYSTARSVASLHFTFAGTPGARLQTGSLTANAEPTFASWYESANSRQFGSLFIATVNLQIVGDLSTLDSITVTAANSRGSSAPVTVNLR
jgi:hypothetical protein